MNKGCPPEGRPSLTDRFLWGRASEWVPLLVYPSHLFQIYKSATSRLVVLLKPSLSLLILGSCFGGDDPRQWVCLFVLPYVTLVTSCPSHLLQTSRWWCRVTAELTCAIWFLSFEFWSLIFGLSFLSYNSSFLIFDLPFLIFPFSFSFYYFFLILHFLAFVFHFSLFIFYILFFSFRFPIFNLWFFIFCCRTFHLYCPILWISALISFLTLHLW